MHSSAICDLFDRNCIVVIGKVHVGKTLWKTNFEIRLV